jgi:DNA repair protein RadD
VLPIVSTQAPLTSWVSIRGVRYSRHVKPGRPPCLRVDYFCGLNRFSEWLHPERPGYPRQKAAQWWTQRGGQQLPATVDEALRLAGQLTTPVQIQVRRNGQYDEVVGARF